MHDLSRQNHWIALYLLITFSLDSIAAGVGPTEVILWENPGYSGLNYSYDIDPNKNRATADIYSVFALDNIISSMEVGWRPEFMNMMPRNRTFPLKNESPGIRSAITFINTAGKIRGIKGRIPQWQPIQSVIWWWTRMKPGSGLVTRERNTISVRTSAGKNSRRIPAGTQNWPGHSISVLTSPAEG